MATNPKLEFYLFNLKHKKKDSATFKDFVLDELGGRPRESDDTLFKRIFSHFKDNLGSKHAKNNTLKKMLKLEKGKNNTHLSKQPKPNSTDFTISGVINGGPYGRDRILGDTQDDEESAKLGESKVIYLYFYFYAYFPLDHDQGFFAIHSNNVDESITALFRNYISKIFSGKNYNKGNATVFCPKSFQDDFKNDALIQSIVFEEKYLDNTFNTSTSVLNLPEYQIKIEAIPKSGKIPFIDAEKVMNYFAKMFFGKKDHGKQLENFDSTKVKTKKNKKSKSTKVFEWNKRDSNFVPVVYLKDIIDKFNQDGTPDFEALETYCKMLFKDDILKEIRPDLNVVRVN